jgi:hypothetical protein
MVTEVLLHDGIWHRVSDGSFEVKRPRFFSRDSGERDVSLSQGAWFNFTDLGEQTTISGPLSAVYGLKRKQPANA